MQSFFFNVTFYWFACSSMLGLGPVWPDALVLFRRYDAFLSLGSRSCDNYCLVFDKLISWAVVCNSPFAILWDGEAGHTSLSHWHPWMQADLLDAEHWMQSIADPWMQTTLPACNSTELCSWPAVNQPVVNQPAPIVACTKSSHVLLVMSLSWCHCHNDSHS